MTCPLVTFPVRDMLLKACSLDCENTSLNLQRISALIIVFCAFICAYYLDGSFAYVCGLIGSCATVFDSIILPVIFYNVVHQYHHHHHHVTYWLHVAILIIAVTSAFVGIYSNIAHVISS